MKLGKEIACSLVFIFMFSCANDIRIPNKNKLALTESLDIQIINTPVQTCISNLQVPTFLELLGFNNLNVDTIRVHFNSNKQLILSFKHNSGNRVEAVDGKLRNGGFYEMFVRKRRIEIPPNLTCFL